MYLSCLYKIYTFPVFTPLSQCLVVGTSHQTMGPYFPRVTLRSIQAQLTAPGWLLWLLDLASNWTSPSFKFMGHTTSLLSGKKWQRNRLQICRSSFNETMRTVCNFKVILRKAVLNFTTVSEILKNLLSDFLKSLIICCFCLLIQCLKYTFAFVLDWASVGKASFHHLHNTWLKLPYVAPKPGFCIHDVCQF